MQPPNETPVPGGYNPCYNPRPPPNCGPQVRPTPYGAGPVLDSATLRENSGPGYYNLGTQYYQGNNTAKAYGAYLRSAQMGYVKGQAAAGMMLLDGEGVSRNAAAAASWLKKAADQGHVKAQYTMGGLYEDGVGVTRDNSQAMRYYVASAEQGFGRAAFRVGLAYAIGDLAPRNRSAATSWLRRAASNGFSFASTISATLADSSTPQFSSIDELTNYLRAQAAQAQANARQASCGPAWACLQASQELERWRIQSQNEFLPPKTKTY